MQRFNYWVLFNATYVFISKKKKKKVTNELWNMFNKEKFSRKENNSEKIFRYSTEDGSELQGRNYISVVAVSRSF